MVKSNLDISFTENVTKELVRLSSKLSEEKSTLGLAYVTQKIQTRSINTADVQKRKGWQFNVFGNVANNRNLQYIEIDGCKVVIFTPQELHRLKGKKFDLVDGWLVEV